MMENTQALQETIRLWFDFGWEMMSHPLITFFVGIFGGAHFNGGVRKLYGKAAKKVLPTQKPKSNHP